MVIEGRTVGEIVAEDYRLGSVFKQFGIDFCCGGGKSVEDACRTRGIDLATLKSALIAAAGGRTPTAAPDTRNWSPGFLADYIVNVHHTYVRESLPILQAFSHKVARVHGEALPALYEVAERVIELSDEMTVHMAREESVVFPQVKAITESSGDGANGATLDAEALDLLVDEHDHAGGLMLRIRELTDGFVPPEWACNTFRALYAKLEEFEDDLHRHVHLENNVLFPAVSHLANPNQDRVSG